MKFNKLAWCFFLSYSLFLLTYSSVALLNPALFAPPVAYDSGGSNAFSVTVADVNGDGKQDLVVANVANGVAVLLGNGDGTFQTPVSYASGGRYVYSVAVADLNGDGKPDLAVRNDCGLSTCGGTDSRNSVRAVARRNLYLERLSITRTAWEILLEIESFREEVRHRRWESIPH